MRVTTKGRYALRAVLRLAMDENGKPISIRVLSETEDISAEFLEQIFFRLRKAGIISSTRGPGGGFKLDRDLSDISVAEIFEAVGEEIHFAPCTKNDDELAEPCDRQNFCHVHEFWEHTYHAFERYFRTATLEDILHERYPQCAIQKAKASAIEQ
jgi:Rrf2 family iron-sulfur cluster assembly transcriptional regulator